MPNRHAFRRGAFVGALWACAMWLAAATAAPAAGCPLMPLDELARGLGAADRFELGIGQVRPFLILWYRHRMVDLPDSPDGVTLFVRGSEDLLIAFRRRGCLIGVLAAERAELWRAMFEHIGPIA